MTFQVGDWVEHVETQRVGQVTVKSVAVPGAYVIRFGNATERCDEPQLRPAEKKRGS